MEPDSNALVVRARFDSANLDRSTIEFDAVRFSGHLAHRADKLCDVVQLVTCPSGEIDVHGWPRERRPPGGQQERAFQNEPIRERRLRKAIEESLHGEVLEEFLERTALRARVVEQSLPDRGADVATAHSTASRYGRMTLWTRLIWANLDSA